MQKRANSASASPSTIAAFIPEPDLGSARTTELPAAAASRSEIEFMASGVSQAAIQLALVPIDSERQRSEHEERRGLVGSICESSDRGHRLGRRRKLPSGSLFPPGGIATIIEGRMMEDCWRPRRSIPVGGFSIPVGGFSHHLLHHQPL